MLPPRPIHPKELNVCQLNSNEDFSSGRNVKVGTIFHLSCILFHAWKLTFTMATISMFLFFKISCWRFLGFVVNNQGTKSNH